MSLELDQRSDLPIPQRSYSISQKESYRYQGDEQADNTAYPTGDYTPHTSAQLHTFKRSTVVLLSTALAVIVILAVVAAAVGGSIAEERKNKIHRLEKLLDHQCTANTTAISSNQNFSSSSASSMIAGATSTSTPTSILYDPFKDHIIPSSNCSDMGSTYISAGSKASFTIHCETDFRQGDIMGVWVFTFADCMEACAAYNNKKNSPPCYAVSYDPEGDIFTQWSGFGNCFLKGSKDIPALSTNLTSSAVFNFDS